MVEVSFYILLKDEFICITVGDNRRIHALFQQLKSEYLASRLLGRLGYTACKFHRLKKPVPFPDSDDTTGTLEACMDKSNWEIISSSSRVKGIALDSELTDDYVYLVIELPSDETERAIANLNLNNADMFQRLQITVSRLNSWSKDDVIRNLDGGDFAQNSDPSHEKLAEIEDRLSRIQTYAQPAGEPSRDLQNALSYRTYFDNVFSPVTMVTRSVTVRSDRIFAAFYNLLRCYQEDAARIKDNSSSSLKASTFTVYFILPPFFSCQTGNECFEYVAEKPWQFPIFISTRDAPDSWCKFTPSSDFSVYSPNFLCPFIISEVISQKNEQDRWRMLAQAVAISRVGQFLLKTGSRKQFFVVAIYLRANLTAERFIVAQTGPNQTVSIAQKDFDLSNAEKAVEFFREMYNLTTALEDLAEDLDEKKKDSLQKIRKDASKVISLTSKAKQKPAKGSTMGSISEEHGEEGLQDDLGIFAADDIQAILNKMNYQVDYCLFGHPRLARVSSTADYTECGYLKFVEEGQREVEILQYLAGIDMPSNHTISGIRIWPVNNGSVISMPVAGGWLTSLETPDAHLWSVVKQLFEAVDFMHSRGVAHMDLKPQNIIVPRQGGWLSIIDFSSSVRVKGPKHMFRGVVGTEDYIPPEVAAGREYYSAIRADLWSCGKTLQELCLCCSPSPDREALLEIARQLTNDNPGERPMMSHVLEWMSSLKRDFDTRTARPSSASFPSVSSREVTV